MESLLLRGENFKRKLGRISFKGAMFVAILFLFAIAYVYNIANAWYEVENSSLSNIEYPLMLAGNDKVYIVGGGEEEFFSIYDLISGELHDKSDSVLAEGTSGVNIFDGSYGTMGVDGNVYYVKDSFSGIRAISDDEMSNEVIEMEDGTKRSHAALVAVNEYLYLIGGVNSENDLENNIYRYDTKAKEWYDTSVKFPTKGIMAFNIGGQIYIFGGQGKEDEVSVWNPNNNEVYLRTNMPFELDLSNDQKLVKASSMNGKVYFRKNDNLWEYHPYSNRWELIEFAETFLDMSNFNQISGSFSIQDDAIKSNGDGIELMLFKEALTDYQLDMSIDYVGGQIIIPIKSLVDGSEKTYLKIEEDKISLHYSESFQMLDSEKISSKKRNIQHGIREYNIIVADGYIGVWEDGKIALNAYSSNIDIGYIGFGGVDTQLRLEKFHVVKSKLSEFKNQEMLLNGSFEDGLDGWSFINAEKEETGIEFDGSKVKITGDIENGIFQEIDISDIEDEMLLISAKIKGEEFVGEAVVEYELVLDDYDVIKSGTLGLLQGSSREHFEKLISVPDIFNDKEHYMKLIGNDDDYETDIGNVSLRLSVKNEGVREQQSEDEDSDAEQEQLVDEEDDEDEGLDYEYQFFRGEIYIDFIDALKNHRNGDRISEYVFYRLPLKIRNKIIEGEYNNIYDIDLEFIDSLNQFIIQQEDFYKTEYKYSLLNSEEIKDGFIDNFIDREDRVSRYIFERITNPDLSELGSEDFTTLNAEDFAELINESLIRLKGFYDEDAIVSFLYPEDVQEEFINRLRERNKEDEVSRYIFEILYKNNATDILEDSYGQSLFYDGDIKVDFIDKLSTPDLDQVSQHIIKLLPQEIQVGLDSNQISMIDKNFIEAMNEIIMLESFYDEDIFSDLDLNDEIQELIAKQSEGEINQIEVNKLNRLLLEEYYTEEIMVSDQKFEMGMDAIDVFNDVIIRAKDFYDPNYRRTRLYQDEIKEKFFDQLRNRQDDSSEYIFRILDEDTKMAISQGAVFIDGVIDDAIIENINDTIIYSEDFYNESFNQVNSEAINDGFIDRLKSKDDEMAQYIFERLTTQTQENISEGAILFDEAHDNFDENINQEFIEEFNSVIIKSEDFYNDDEEAFNQLSIDFDQRINNLIDNTSKSSIEIERLNRLILEKWGGEDIARSQGLLLELSSEGKQEFDWIMEQISNSALSIDRLNRLLIEEFSMDGINKSKNPFKGYDLESNLNINEFIQDEDRGSVETYIFNRLILEEVYEDELEKGDYVFEDLDLEGNSEFKELLENYPQIAHRAHRLNRLIVESYYPENIVKSKEIFDPDDVQDNREISRLLRGSLEHDYEIFTLNRLIMDEYYSGKILESSYTQPVNRVLDGVQRYGALEAAYGLRRLRSAYRGRLIRIRKDDPQIEKDEDDNPILDEDGEQIINYEERSFYPDRLGELSLTSTDGIMSTGTMLGEWIGDSDGYVVTWYDQSGLGRDATQLELEYQPKIITSGEIITVDENPGISFQKNKRTHLNSGGMGNIANLSLNLVNVWGENRDDNQILLSTLGRHRDNSFYITNRMASDAYSFNIHERMNLTNAIPYINNRVNIYTILSRMSRTEAYISGILDGVSEEYSGRKSFTDIVIGGWDQNLPRGRNTFYDGSISEMIIYSDVLDSSQRQLIEDDQIDYFGVSIPEKYQSYQLRNQGNIVLEDFSVKNISYKENLENPEITGFVAGYGFLYQLLQDQESVMYAKNRSLQAPAKINALDYFLLNGGDLVWLGEKNPIARVKDFTGEERWIRQGLDWFLPHTNKRVETSVDGDLLGSIRPKNFIQPVGLGLVNRQFAYVNTPRYPKSTAWQADWNVPLSMDFLKSEEGAENVMDNLVDSIRIKNWRVKPQKDGLVMDINANRLEVSSGGGVFVDLSQSNNVIYSKGATFLHESPDGEALRYNYYNNEGQYIDVKNPNYLKNIEDGLTFMSYLAFDELKDEQMLLYVDSEDSNTVIFVSARKDGEDKEVLFGFDNDEGSSFIKADIELQNVQNTERFYHIAVTIDEAKNAKIYLDGELVGSDTIEGFPYEVNSIGSCYIGADGDGGRNFKGSFQSAKMFERNLSENEIKDEYNDMKGYILGNDNGWINNREEIVNLEEIAEDGVNVMRAFSFIESESTQLAILKVDNTDDLFVVVNGKMITGSLNKAHIELIGGINKIELVSKRPSNKLWEHSASIIPLGSSKTGSYIKDAKEGEKLQSGYVDKWQLNGPFETVNDDSWLDLYYDFLGSEVRFSKPNLEIDVDGWQDVNSNNGVVDLNISYDEYDIDEKVFYARAKVYSDEYKEARLYFEARDRGKLWLNGKTVVGTLDRNFRGIDSGSYFDVSLKKGENVILLKIINRSGPSYFSVKIEPKELVSSYANEISSLPSGNFTYLMDRGIENFVLQWDQQEFIKTVLCDDRVVMADYDQEYGGNRVWDNYIKEYVEYFEHRGFVRKNGKNIRDWMMKKMANGDASGTVVIIANDYIPASILESQDHNATLRRYLDKGGRVVWYGYRPMRNLQWLSGRQERIDALGPVLDIFSSDTTHESREVEFLSDRVGEDILSAQMELIGDWRSRASLDENAMIEDGVIPLAQLTDGNISAWMKNYNWEYPHSGFIRLYDAPVENNENWKENIYKAAIFELGERLVYIDETLRNEESELVDKFITLIEKKGYRSVNYDDLVELVMGGKQELGNISSLVVASNTLPTSFEIEKNYFVEQNQVHIGFKDQSDSENTFIVWLNDEEQKRVTSHDPTNIGRSYLSTIDNLDFEQDYNVKIKAAYVSKSEIESQQSKGKALEIEFTAQGIEKPRDLRVQNLKDSQVQISWRYLNESVDGFRIYEGSEKILDKSVEEVSSSKEYSVIIEEIELGQMYDFGVSAYFEEKESDRAFKSFEGVPEAPFINLSATSGILGNQWSNTGARAIIRLDWEDVPGASSYVIYLHDGYTWRRVDRVAQSNWDSNDAKIYPSEEEINQYRENEIPRHVSLFKSPGSGEDLRDSPNDLWLRSAGVTYNNDHSYRVRVRAKNIVGISDWSNEIVKEFPNRTDTQPPEGRITVNQGMMRTVRRDIEVYLGEVYDVGGSGLGTVEYSFDGVNWSRKENFPIDDSKVIHINLPDVTDWITLSVRVTDNAGNSKIFTSSLEVVTGKSPPKIHNMTIKESRRITGLDNPWSSAESQRENFFNLIDSNYSTGIKLREMPVDFGVKFLEEELIDAVRVFWEGDSSGDYPESYEVQLKKQGDWNVVKTVDATKFDSGNHEIEFNQTIASGVRILAYSMPSEYLQVNQLDVFRKQGSRQPEKITFGDSVGIYFDVDDRDTPNDKLNVRLSNDGERWSSWKRIDEAYPPKGIMYWRLSEGEGSKVVYAEVMDEYGNVSEANANILRVPQEELEGRNVFNIERRANQTGEVYIEGERVITSQTNSIGFLAFIPVDITKILISWDGLNWNEEVLPTPSQEQEETGYRDFKMRISYPGEDALRDLQVRFLDSDDNIVMMESKRILFDKQPPEISISTLSQSMVTSSEYVDVLVSVKDNISNNFTYSLNGGEVRKLPQNRIIRYEGLTSGLNVIRIKVMDESGNHTFDTLRIRKM